MSLGTYILGIEGDDKSGKTSLLLTAPRPLHHMDLDVGGFRRARHRFQNPDGSIQSGITSTPYYLPRQAVVDQLRQGSRQTSGKAPSVLKPTSILRGYKELWYQMLTDYADKLEDPNIQTIGFDSWVQVWELCRFAYLQEIQERGATSGKIRESLLQIEYGEPNARMRQLLYAAREMDKNLVLTHYMTEERQDRLVDGSVVSVVVGWKHAGWRYLDKEADVVVRTEMRPDKNGKLTPWGTIRINGLALDATGTDLPNPTWTQITQTLELTRG